jgi:hypothetical protein
LENARSEALIDQPAVSPSEASGAKPPFSNSITEAFKQTRGVVFAPVPSILLRSLRMVDPQMYQDYADRPWSIRRNGQERARATTRREADGIIRQLQKFDRSAEFTITYQGKSIAHCTNGGRALR